MWKMEPKCPLNATELAHKEMKRKDDKGMATMRFSNNESAIYANQVTNLF